MTSRLMAPMLLAPIPCGTRTVAAGLPPGARTDPAWLRPARKSACLQRTAPNSAEKVDAARKESVLAGDLAPPAPAEAWRLVVRDDRAQSPLPAAWAMARMAPLVMWARMARMASREQKLPVVAPIAARERIEDLPGVRAQRQLPADEWAAPPAADGWAPPSPEWAAAPPERHARQQAQPAPVLRQKRVPVSRGPQGALRALPRSPRRVPRGSLPSRRSPVRVPDRAHRIRKTVAA